MSLLPLPRTKCGLVRVRKQPPDVPGTANISTGHRLREREGCRVSKQSVARESFFERSADENPEDAREIQHIAKCAEFEKETNRKIRKKKVRQRVEEGMAAYEESVNSRRERLRGLMLAEETSLTREMVAEAQRGSESRAIEARERDERLAAEQESQRRALAASKRVQQYLARCPEVRHALSRRLTRDAKLANRRQIADREAGRREARDLDALWHELMLREVAAKRRREEEEEERRAEAKRLTRRTLDEQLADRLALEEHRKREAREEREELERLWETVREEERARLEEERRRRDALRKELEEQVLAAKRELEGRARREIEIDRAFDAMAREELDKERSDVRESASALRRELQAYLGYLEELRRVEAERSREVDAIVRQSMRDANERRELATRMAREARRRALEEVRTGRERQMMERREAEERERGEREREREEVCREIELDAKLTQEERRRRKERAIRYGGELMEQASYVDAIRRRSEREEDERIVESGLRREEEYSRLARELVNASENVAPHPFKVALMGLAEMRATEACSRSREPDGTPLKES